MLASPLNTNGSHLPCFDVYISKKKKVGGRGKTDIQSLIQTLKDQMFLRIAIF